MEPVTGGGVGPRPVLHVVALEPRRIAALEALRNAVQDAQVEAARKLWEISRQRAENHDSAEAAATHLSARFADAATLGEAAAKASAALGCAPADPWLTQAIESIAHGCATLVDSGHASTTRATIEAHARRALIATAMVRDGHLMVLTRDGGEVEVSRITGAPVQDGAPHSKGTDTEMWLMNANARSSAPVLLTGGEQWTGQ